MTWFLLSLTAALGLATADALTKRFFSDLPPYRMGVVRILSTAPWMVLALLFLPAAVPDRTFWLAIAAALPLELAAFFLYMRALKLSPLSLSLPFLAFTPVFMILTGRLILDEALTAGGVLGILLIVLGAYVLNLSKMKSGLLGPIRAVMREPGSWIMLLVSFVYSITAPIGKVAILHSNPWFFAAVYNLVLSVVIVSLWPVAAGGCGGARYFQQARPHAAHRPHGSHGEFCPHDGHRAGRGGLHDRRQAAEPALRGSLRGVVVRGRKHPRAPGRRRHHDRGRVPDPLGTGGMKKA